MIPIQTIKALADIPLLGAGLSYRREHKQAILTALTEIDFVEIITDQYIHHPCGNEELEQLCEVFHVIPHGVGLSIGSLMPFDDDYLRAIKCISDLTQSPYYSEHLCITRVPGIEIGHLSPLWFTDEMLAHTIRNVSFVQDYLGKPLILENVAYLVDIPHSPLSQTDFFKELVRATNCGVLLDLTNIYINSVNHHFDTMAFLEAMPLDHVVQVHLAGGYWSHGLLIDGHSQPVHEECWQLLEMLASRVTIRGTIIEYDRNFPATTLLLQEVARARRIVSGTTQA